MSNTSGNPQRIDLEPHEQKQRAATEGPEARSSQISGFSSIGSDRKSVESKGGRVAYPTSADASTLSSLTSHTESPMSPAALSDVSDLTDISALSGTREEELSNGILTTSRENAGEDNQMEPMDVDSEPTVPAARPPPGESNSSSDSGPITVSSEVLRPEDDPLAVKKRKEVVSRSDAYRSRSRRSTTGEPTKKWFTLPVLDSGKAVTRMSVLGVSCRGIVGNRGYCQFDTLKDGEVVKCGVELVKKNVVLYAHFAMHLAELNYREKAIEDPSWRPVCPWCHHDLTTVDNFLRHIVYSELQLNKIRCACGGTVSRGNQVSFIRRHEASRRHREYVARKNSKAASKPDGEREEHIEENSTG